MSVDAKLFVTCGKDKLFEVMHEVMEVTDGYARHKLNNFLKYGKTNHNATSYLRSEEYLNGDLEFSRGATLHAYNMDVLSVLFGCGDENKRQLNVFPDCSCSASEVFEGRRLY